jgi:ATP-dependent Clp endopeptidase proteolytic subunit ClpP
MTDKSDWYKIKNLSGSKSAEVTIYDEIGQFGITAHDFVNDIQSISCETMTVHLNTPGGDVFDGLTIYNALKQHPAEVTVVVDGLAASIGSVIAMAGDRVVMAKTATMMIHDAWTVGLGNAADMRKTADLLDKTSDNLARVYAERTGTESEDWRTKMREETWFSADEAVEAGLADEVQSSGKKVQNKFDLSNYGYDKAPASVVETEAEVQT